MIKEIWRKNPKLFRSTRPNLSRSLGLSFPLVKYEEKKIYNFLLGLREDIKKYLSIVKCTIFKEQADQAIYAEIEINTSETCQKMEECRNAIK